MQLRNIRFSAVWIACFGFVLFLIVGLSLRSWTVDAQVAPEKLNLEVSSEKQTFLRAEPVPIKFVLSNRTSSPITWKGILGIGENMNLIVRKPDGGEVRWEGRKISIGTLLALPVSLAPGQETSAESILSSVELLETIFPHPGRYGMKIEFAYTAGPEVRELTTIQSDYFPIEIKEPVGDDYGAYQFIRENLVSVVKQSDVGLIARKQQEFVDRFGNSPYGKYVTFKLANIYFSLGEHRKAAREICKLSGQNFYYSKTVEKKAYELEAKLRPFVMVELPENAPLPPRPHPCTRMLN